MITDQTYKNVAEHCSAFQSRENEYSSQNKSGDSCCSCKSCTHFVNDNHCELDLLDPIVENHNF